MPPNIQKCHYVMSLELLLSSLLISEASVSVYGQIWCRWVFFSILLSLFLKNYDLTLLVIKVSTSFLMFFIFNFLS
jgi:hypothetical protein